MNSPKPISNKAFYLILEDFIKQIEFVEEISFATMQILDLILCDCSPDDADFWLEEDPDEEFIDEMEYLINDCSKKDGIKNYAENLFETFFDQHDHFNKALDIGDPHYHRYKDLKEFIKDVNHKLLDKILKNCWERSSTTEEKFFSREEIFNILF